MDRAQLFRSAWNASVSAKAYNADWWETLTPETEPALWTEYRHIHVEEMNLGSIPEWAEEIVVRMMELPMCGYYAYPANVMQIIEAIAAERCPDVVMRCYTVDPARKILLSHYVFCLDSWWKQAPLEHVITELAQRDQLGKDWSAIATAMYDVLGVRTELKAVVVERLIHRLRWWIKSLIWVDDKRESFMLDFYGGDIRGDVQTFGTYGNDPYGDPYFVELQLPHIKTLETRIRSDAPNGDKLLDRIHSTWLCAPKMFRYLEKLIAEIGTTGSTEPFSNVPSFLQCEDTYPDFAANSAHYDQLVEHLQQWRTGSTQAFPELGEITPVKRWLVHLLWHKLVFHVRYEENFAKMMGKCEHGKSGTGKPSDYGPRLSVSVR